MTEQILDALGRCDALLTSGGVSVGDFDYVSNALERIAADDPDGRARVDWYQVAIRPAKPLCFSFVRGTPVFGLPGNPVSSLVSFELFARPALEGDGRPADLDAPVVLAARPADDASPARRQAAPRPRRARRWSTVATSRRASARRRATSSRRPPRRTASRCCPTATASRRATRCTSSCSDSLGPATATASARGDAPGTRLSSPPLTACIAPTTCRPPDRTIVTARCDSPREVREARRRRVSR